MKKALSLILALAMLIALAACGSAPAQTSTDAQEEAPQEAPAVEETAAPKEETPATEKTAEETTNTVKVTFDYNYDGAPESTVIEVEAGGVIQPFDGETANTAPETPTREGYRFAGWDTEKEPVLENGYSATAWPIGDYYLVWYVELGPAMGVEEEKMPLDVDTTLYARWVEKTVINTPEELLAMHADLSGWYELGSDIDLSGIEWIPVGTYVSHYEYLNPSWWREAFRGEFDGAGHTITGLALNTVSYYEDDISTRKGIRNGVAAMFGAAGDGATIHDLTLDAPVIDVTSDIHYAYVAPLTGIVEGCNFTNCHVTNMSFKAAISDVANTAHETATPGIYASLSGLIGGVWAGTVENCSVEGAMEISLESVIAHQGSAFVGGVLGDGYIPLTNCSSNVAITCSYQDSFGEEFAFAEDFSNGLNLMVGGTTGLAAALIMCSANGDVTISNLSEAGNLSLLCEGSYGMILGGEEAIVGSDYTGNLVK